LASTLDPKYTSEMARQALTCDFTTGDSFYYLSLAKANADTVIGECTDELPTDTYTDKSCWVVQGEITPEVLFSKRRRHLDVVLDTEVYTSINVLMAKIIPELTGGVFGGFTNVDSLTAGGEDGVTVNNPFSERGVPIIKNDTPEQGFIIIGVAGACLLVFVTLLITRQRQRRAAYLKHLEEVADLDLDSDTQEEMKQQEYVVDENESLDLDETFLQLASEMQHHDDRNCVSGTCEICQRDRKRPIFIAADTDALEKDIKVDLGPKSYVRQTNQSHVDDTQIL
jgi:hypothetical protein